MEDLRQRPRTKYYKKNQQFLRLEALDNKNTAYDF